MNEKLSLGAISLETRNRMEKQIQEQDMDRVMAKEYTLEEAAALYCLLSGACKSGTLDYINDCGFAPTEMYTMQDIIDKSNNQVGHHFFVRKVEMMSSGQSVDTFHYENGIEIPDNEGKRHWYDIGFSELGSSGVKINQKNGDGSIKKVAPNGIFHLYVEVSTNTNLQLADIKHSGDMDIHVSTAKAVNAGVGDDNTINKDNAIRLVKWDKVATEELDGTMNISVSTCGDGIYGILAKTIKVDIATSWTFKLYALDFKTIEYRHNSCSNANIYVEKNTKFKIEYAHPVYKDRVIIEDGLCDDSATRIIKIEYLGEGDLYIRKHE